MKAAGGTPQPKISTNFTTRAGRLEKLSLLGNLTLFEPGPGRLSSSVVCSVFDFVFSLNSPSPVFAWCVKEPYGFGNFSQNSAVPASHLERMR
jgi:hypothetical protein